MLREVQEGEGAKLRIIATTLEYQFKVPELTPLSFSILQPQSPISNSLQPPCPGAVNFGAEKCKQRDWAKMQKS